jgi:hypothetical protein
LGKAGAGVGLCAFCKEPEPGMARFRPGSGPPTCARGGVSFSTGRRRSAWYRFHGAAHGKSQCLSSKLARSARLPRPRCAQPERLVANFRNFDIVRPAVGFPTSKGPQVPSSRRRRGLHRALHIQICGAASCETLKVTNISEADSAVLAIASKDAYSPIRPLIRWICTHWVLCGIFKQPKIVSAQPSCRGGCSPAARVAVPRGRPAEWRAAADRISGGGLGAG